MCSCPQPRRRGNATVIALIALVTALLALVIAFLALMQGGGSGDARQQTDRPAPAAQPTSPVKQPGTPPAAVQPILPDADPSAEKPVPPTPPGAGVTEPTPTPAITPTPGAPIEGEAEPSATPPVTTVTPIPETTPETRLDDEPTRAGVTPPPPEVATPENAETPGGRSPIPGEGEDVTEPIPAERLVQEPTEPRPTGVIDWTEAKNHVGQEITARGTVVSTNNIGDLTFLNFDTDWQDKFYIVIFREAYDDTPGGNPELAYLNHTIEVTGEVSTHRGRPQIQVRDASQIKVVD